MRTAVFLVACLVTVTALPAAAAQAGPAPGHDPASYITEWAPKHANELAADPASTHPEGEATHAAWWACWTLDEAADGEDLGGTCQAYYQPPGEAAPEPLPDDEAEDHDEHGGEADDLTQDVAEDTAEYAEEIAEATQDLLEDPTTAPGFVERVADATAAFVTGTADKVVALITGLIGGTVEAVVTTVKGLIGGLGLGISAGAQAGESVLTATLAGVTTTAQAIGNGFTAAGKGIANAATATVQGVTQGVAAVGDGIASAFQSAWDAATSLFADDKAPATRLPGQTEGPLTGIDGVTSNLLDMVP